MCYINRNLIISVIYVNIKCYLRVIDSCISPASTFFPVLNIALRVYSTRLPFFNFHRCSYAYFQRDSLILVH